MHSVTGAGGAPILVTRVARERHDDGLGRQGGDVEPHIRLDLSSCVNPYGPAPSAMTRLSSLEAAIVRKHPYLACDALESLYARRLVVPEDQLVATRAASEALWHLSHVFADRHVVLPLPTYTEYVRCFPNARRVATKRPFHCVEQLDACAQAADVVIISNPHNPTGRFMQRSEIEHAASRHPDCIFVIDESYDDFVSPDESPTLAGTELENIVILRSPTKFYGLGGVRVGVVWSRSRWVLDELRARRTTWPISMIDVELVGAAFDDVEWQRSVRGQLSADATWLDAWLRRHTGLEVIDGPLHFRLVTGAVSGFEERLRERGVHVRVLGKGHGVGANAIRVSAPRLEDRPVLADL